MKKIIITGFLLIFLFVPKEDVTATEDVQSQLFQLRAQLNSLLQILNSLLEQQDEVVGVEDFVLDQFGVTESEYDQCMNENRFAQLVKDDYSFGSKLGVRGTPSTFILDHKKEDVVRISGGQSFNSIKILVDAIFEDHEDLEELYEGNYDLFPQEEFVRGDQDARLTFVEFSDIECPFCGRFHQVMKNVLEEYPEDVNWAYRHFPLSQIHPRAERVAQAVECIGDLEGAESRWDALDALFEDRDLLEVL